MHRSPRFIKALLCGRFLWAAAITLSVSAATVTLPPVEDATISEKSLEVPLGGQSTLESGTTGPSDGARKSRVLLKFDLAANIPSGATVTSAALTLTVSQNPPTSTNLWFDLRKVLRNWSEAGTTWTFPVSSLDPWSIPGGAAAADYTDAVSQSTLVTGLGSFTFASSPTLIEDVQAWLDRPELNHGWIMINQHEALLRSVRKFYSREGSNPPSLAVEFTLPFMAPKLMALLPVNDHFQFEFTAEPNRSYTVEYLEDLETASWSVLTHVDAPALATNILVTDPSDLSGPRYYRVFTP